MSVQIGAAGGGRRSTSPDEVVKARLAACTSCGICNGVCPTYRETADERDGPRGRIALMQHLIAEDPAAWGLPGRAQGGLADADMVGRYLDRCLACGACDAICPEDVGFEEALRAARALLSDRRQRGAGADLREALLDGIVDPESQRRTLRMARFLRPLRGALAKAGFAAAAETLDQAPVIGREAARFVGPGIALTEAERRGRVLLVPGCLQSSVRPAIQDATIRLLGRRGFDVEVPAGAGCCGAISDQLGQAADAAARIEVNVLAWSKAQARAAADPLGGPFDALITTGRFCRKMLGTYRDRLGGLAVSADVDHLIGEASDILTFLSSVDFGAPSRWSSIRVGYLASCHCDAGGGKRVGDQANITLLSEAGYTVQGLLDEATCCGGPGAYPWLAPELAQELRRRKVRQIRSSEVDVIATSDVGCIVGLGDAPAVPVVHVVELIDWAYGGPAPAELAALADRMTDVPEPPRLAERVVT